MVNYTFLQVLWDLDVDVVTCLIDYDVFVREIRRRTRSYDHLNWRLHHLY